MDPSEFALLLDGGPAYAVRVEYLIVHGPPENGVDIVDLLVGRLSDVLDVNQNVFDPETAAGMIVADVQRLAFSPQGAMPSVGATTLYGFTLMLPPETARPENVVKEFTAALSQTPPITHALKFFDSLLWRQNGRLAEELFELEMKLRRILSIIYLHRSPAKPYELLCDDWVQPMKKEKPEPKQMLAAVENEFFHLTFGQYPALNQRKLPSNIQEMLPLIRDALSFEHFRFEIARLPVENEHDRDFVSGLAEALGTVEKVRNAIAHNRTVPKKTLEDYEKNAKPALDKLLNEYLQRWAIESAGEEMPWEYETRRAIEEEMARAEWNASAGCVLFAGDDEPHHQDIEIRDKEALARHLEEIGEIAWCGSRPSYGEGEAPEPEVEGMVGEVMDSYADQIAAVFKAVENGASDT